MRAAVTLLTIATVAVLAVCWDLARTTIIRPRDWSEDWPGRLTHRINEDRP
jgi:hypothetical protein